MGVRRCNHYHNNRRMDKKTMTNQRFVLSLKPEAYYSLQNTLHRCDKTLHIVSMHPAFKQELINDFTKIKETLHKAEKGAEG
jgi:hypothetical protein